MTNILPQYTGLTVTAISYRYTTIKEVSDPMLVHIRNYSLSGNDYVFQSTDNWSYLPGNTITKTIPADISYTLLGNGELTVEGRGTVANASVGYTYTYDLCNTDPMYSPTCPGYAVAMTKKSEEAVSYELASKETYTIAQTKLPSYYNEDESVLKKDRQLDDEEQRRRKRRGLQAATNALTEAYSLSQEAVIAAMNFVPQFQTYYSVTLVGGTYADVPGYAVTQLPENKKALRVGLAQQTLHKKMVESQYQISH